MITGPSGVGKGTLVARLLQRHPLIWLSVSATTRLPRDGEVEGSSYFFLDRPSFERQVAEGGFLEWAEFAGNLYGTPRQPVESQLAAGRPVLLEIELEGARQVRRSFPAGFQVFLEPPSFEELERRIRGRGTDSEEAIARRLERARVELAAALNQQDQRPNPLPTDSTSLEPCPPSSRSRPPWSSPPPISPPT